MAGPLESWDAPAVQGWLAAQPALGKYATLLEVRPALPNRPIGLGHDAPILAGADAVSGRRGPPARTSCASRTICSKRRA